MKPELLNCWKCAFCGEEMQEDEVVVITDGETLQEIEICCECEEMYNQKELTQDELQKKIDDVIDNQIEELQFQRAGIMI